MATRSFSVPTSLRRALEKQAATEGETVRKLVTKAVATFLGKRLHALFQESTSRSLVAGKYGGAITCEKLLEHSDFGLETLAGLRGEMVVRDKRVVRVEGSGVISEASPIDKVPFATVTHFEPNIDEPLEADMSLDNLKAHLDKYPPLGQLVLRIPHRWSVRFIRTRAVYAPEPGATLLDAAKTQHEFAFADTTGTLVGIYSQPSQEPSALPVTIFVKCQTTERRADISYRCRRNGLA